MHVTVDLRGEPEVATERWSPDAANRFVDRALEITGLQAIAERQIVSAPGAVLFFQLIAESHICGHLAHGRGWAFIDVFSCRPIDSVQVLKAAVDLFGVGGPVKLRVFEDRGILPEGRSGDGHLG